jgi:hypothetical protein
MRKWKDPEPDENPYLWLMDPDPGGPKTCGSCGSGSPAVVSQFLHGVYSPAADIWAAGGWPLAPRPRPLPRHRLLCPTVYKNSINFLYIILNFLWFFGVPRCFVLPNVILFYGWPLQRRTLPILVHMVGPYSRVGPYHGSGPYGWLL